MSIRKVGSVTNYLRKVGGRIEVGFRRTLCLAEKSAKQQSGPGRLDASKIPTISVRKILGSRAEEAKARLKKADTLGVLLSVHGGNPIGLDQVLKDLIRDVLFVTQDLEFLNKEQEDQILSKISKNATFSWDGNACSDFVIGGFTGIFSEIIFLSVLAHEVGHNILDSKEIKKESIKHIKPKHEFLSEIIAFAFLEMMGSPESIPKSKFLKNDLSKFERAHLTITKEAHWVAAGRLKKFIGALNEKGYPINWSSIAKIGVNIYSSSPELSFGKFCEQVFSEYGNSWLPA